MSAVANNLKYSPRLTFQWRRVEGAMLYQVEEIIEGGDRIVIRDTIAQTDAEYYSYTTAALQNDTDYTFDIIPIDMYENEGDQVPFHNSRVYRNGPAPALTMNFNPITGNVEVRGA